MRTTLIALLMLTPATAQAADLQQMALEIIAQTNQERQAWIDQAAQMAKDHGVNPATAEADLKKELEKHPTSFFSW